MQTEPGHPEVLLAQGQLPPRWANCSPPAGWGAWALCGETPFQREICFVVQVTELSKSELQPMGWEGLHEDAAGMGSRSQSQGLGRAGGRRGGSDLARSSSHPQWNVQVVGRVRRLLPGPGQPAGPGRAGAIGKGGTSLASLAAPRSPHRRSMEPDHISQSQGTDQDNGRIE